MSVDAWIVVGVLVASAAAWAMMFLPPRPGIWPRTWLAAGSLSAMSVLALLALGRLGSTLGAFTLAEVGAGVVVGTAWLVATHLGYEVLRYLFPGFDDEVRDLYRLGEHDTVGRMLGPIVAMGIAEELVFRGVVQGEVGLVLAVLAYGAVQIFERKWALCLAALLAGTVWGLLFDWRSGLVAPAVAHVLWTGALTFVWPLGGAAQAESSSASSRSSRLRILPVELRGSSSTNRTERGTL